MPCQLPGGELNGISVPSICERHGGTWVAEPSLMQGGITPSDSLLGEDTVIPLPTRKIGKSFSGEAGAGYWDTDAFGQPLDWNTGPQGEQYNLFGERDRILANMNANAFDPEPFTPYEIKRETTSQPRILKTKHGQRPMTEQEMIKFNQQNAGNKIKSLFTSTGSTQDKKDATSEVTTGTKPDTTTPTAPTAPTDKPTTPTTPPAPPAPPGKTVQEIAKTGDIPKNIWEQMKTKDYWLKSIEGGSGGWDNRLFRLGEMMSYMGTPLANRGKNPSERWTASAKEFANTSKAAQKAKAKADQDRIDNLIKIADESPSHFASAVAEYLPEDAYWFGMDKADKESMSMQVALVAKAAMMKAASDGKYLPLQRALEEASKRVKDPK